MKTNPITDRIYALHADVQTEDRFEGLWPLPTGITLNSYLVKGDKIALIDLVRDWGGALESLEAELTRAGVKLADVDYLVLNHLEPDHTGWLAEFRAINPGVEILTTAKGVALVNSFYNVTEGLRAVKTGDQLDLGAGMVLEFIETPHVHWPETMCTFEPASGTLFTCDAFGSYGTLGDRVFDDEFDEAEHARFETESLRYYANILATFGNFVQRAIDEIAALDVKVICPSHGMVWRRDSQKVIDRYTKYAGYRDGQREPEICVVWATMYGNTGRGLAAVIEGIESEGMAYTMHRVPNEDPSFILADAYKSEGILIAMPTYEYKMFPPMAYVLSLFDRKRVQGRTVLRIGSWGWIGGAKKEYEAAIEPLEWNSLESVEWSGTPDQDVLATLRESGKELARAVKAACATPVTA